MKSQVVVLSDIHIGDNTPTCWYQKSIHEPYLLAMFDWIVANAADIRELVLLGDVVDLWTYPCDTRPPSFAAIAEENPNIFGPSGGLARVLDALGGGITYVTGNHDMGVTAADVAAIRGSSGRSVAFHEGDYNPGGDPRVLLTHGNAYTMFNAPDQTTKWAPLPVGHFVTRVVATYWAAHLAPGQNVAQLAGQGYPNGLDWSSIIASIASRLDVSIAAALIDGVAGLEGVSESVPVILADGTSTTLSEVKTVYDALFSNWVTQNGGGVDGLLVAGKAALADYDAAYMGWFAQRAAFRAGAQLVVMGHTHEPISGLEQSLIQYVNSGFECPSQPDMAARPICLALVDMNALSARIMAVRGAPPSISPIAYPTTSIVVAPTADRSCYAIINNATDQALTLDAQAVANGHFVTLPTSIPARTSATLWLQDYPPPDPHGSAATVSYRAADGSRMSFTFDCPTGAYSNSVAGGSSFQARSGDGPWLPTGQVPLAGHPLFIRYEVTPGAMQGQFSGQCGQNSSAVSAAGLQVGQAATLNGSADLSRCMIANDNGAVFGIQLQKVEGLYQYQINVDAQGPKGLFSGSMYLYFTDQSGDRYLLTVLDSNRKIHTLQYNSQAPAIMKIEWSNTYIH
jgi:UDP-2,3-diacylglucosamine pyrophosphatase LpxH